MPAITLGRSRKLILPRSAASWIAWLVTSIHQVGRGGRQALQATSCDQRIARSRTEGVQPAGQPSPRRAGQPPARSSRKPKRVTLSDYTSVYIHERTNKVFHVEHVSSFEMRPYGFGEPCCGSWVPRRARLEEHPPRGGEFPLRSRPQPSPEQSTRTLPIVQGGGCLLNPSRPSSTSAILAMFAASSSGSGNRAWRLLWDSSCKVIGSRRQSLGGECESEQRADAPHR